MVGRRGKSRGGKGEGRAREGGCTWNGKIANSGVTEIFMASPQAEDLRVRLFLGVKIVIRSTEDGLGVIIIIIMRLDTRGWCVTPQAEFERSTTFRNTDRLPNKDIHAALLTITLLTFRCF